MSSVAAPAFCSLEQVQYNIENNSSLYRTSHKHRKQYYLAYSVTSGERERQRELSRWQKVRTSKSSWSEILTLTRTLDPSKRRNLVLEFVKRKQFNSLIPAEYNSSSNSSTMKGLFPPNPRSSSSDLKGVGSGSVSDLLSLANAQHHPSDADVSMDDSHASAMTTESMSMTIGSPPRTQRKKRNSIGFRSMAGPILSAGAGATPGTSTNVRSRLFSEDGADLKQQQQQNQHDNPAGAVLKPFNLNQEFANSADPPSPDSRGRTGTNGGQQPSTLTPFRPRHDRQATMALRKRQAEQVDLYGRDWSFDTANDEDAFSAAESPVDMYTSPRISPSTPGRRNSGTNSKNRLAIHRSPFYSTSKPKQQQQQQQLQYHKSPSHFQTLDGRTVQSKNPFSPMIFDETPTPTPSKPLPPGNSPAPGKNGQAATLGLTHPLLLTSDSLRDDTTCRGKSHLVLRHKLQKRGSSPSSNVVGHVMSSPSSAAMTGRMNGMDMDGLTRDGLSSAGGRTTGNMDKNTTSMHDQLEQKASKYIRDGYPEQSGRYSFTGSPIKENFATTTTQALAPSAPNDSSSSKPLLSSVFNPNAFSSTKGGVGNEPQHQDYCTNIHKVRRRSKGDDVVAAAAQGESSWKKKGMYIQTNNNHDNSDTTNDSSSRMNFYNLPSNKPYYYNKDNQQKISKNQKEDSISPTDVFSYPQFRASPSDTSTLPPTPSKPVRRPPIRRYTPIRKTTGPPPTPMPSARQSRSFDFDDSHNNTSVFDGIDIDGDDSSDDEGGNDRISSAQRRRRRRRPKSDAIQGTAAPPPSRFYSDFDVIAELGSGSFGKVFKALSRLDGCFYAIKVAHRVAKGVSDKDRMLKEVYALAALSDQADTATFHIVRYHQAWMEEERLYIQTELCTTTLQAEMQLAAPRQLPLATRYKCLREILLALNFIHSNQMVHLDIKPENIFVSIILEN